MTPTLRKAAILIAALDRKNADALLNQLSPREAQMLRQAVLRLDDVEADEQADVIVEFFEIGPVAPVAPRATASVGVEVALSPAAQAAATQAAAEQSPPIAPTFWQQLDARSLAPLLVHEHAQTVAVVVSHLPHGEAAQLLASLPPALQSEALRRAAELDEMHPDVLKELERGIESWLTRKLRAPSNRQGLSAVSGILRAAGHGAQQTLITNLRQHDRPLADRLAAEVMPKPAAPRFAFDDLAQLEDEALRTVLREAEPELTMLALAGANQRILDRVLSLFSPHDADVLRHELAHLGPVRLSDVEAARQELSRLAQELASAERIHLWPAHLSVAA